MSLLITAAHYTATGLREHNEDFSGMITPHEPRLSTQGIIAVVADGVSGSGGGREAAETSVRSLLKDYYTTPDTWPVTQALDHTIQTINRCMQQQGSQGSARNTMATTLTSLVVRGNRYYFAHVGDTRLYLLRQSTLKRLTTDHVRNSAELRHVLTRAIGLDPHVAIDHGVGDLQQDDIFLIASDGVWGALPESDIEWHLSTLSGDPADPGYTAKLLVDAALANGATDNATALVLRVLKLPVASVGDAGSSLELTTSRPFKQRDPLALWKIIGGVSLVVNLLLLCLLLL